MCQYLAASSFKTTVRSRLQVPKLALRLAQKVAGLHSLGRGIQQMNVDRVSLSIPVDFHWGLAATNAAHYIGGTCLSYPSHTEISNRS